MWIDGHLLDAGEAVAGDTHAHLARAGCHTTTRVMDGSPAFADRHVDRLRRDATSIGLPSPDPDEVRSALFELARAAFPAGPGIVRIKACAAGSDRVCLVGTARPLGDSSDAWQADVAPFPHPGPGEHPGTKLTERPVWTRARAMLAERGVDEVLLFDRAGQLVEGARSNLVVVSATGQPIHPDASLGAVAGIGLAVLTECVSELVPGPLRADDLERAREVIAVNAVRGPRAIVRLDARPVGDGRPGAFARMMSARFETQLQRSLRSTR